MAAAEWQLRKCQVKKHQKQLYIYDQDKEREQWKGLDYNIA
jgi:hypothetical protein